MFCYAEYTDTFGGEPNYSWARRRSFTVTESMSNRTIMRKAKRLLGLTGMRGRTDSWGDVIEFTPYRSCTRLTLMIGDYEYEGGPQ
jgi:hypothetical protein